MRARIAHEARLVNPLRDLHKPQKRAFSAFICLLATHPLPYHRLAQESAFKSILEAFTDAGDSLIQRVLDRIVLENALKLYFHTV